MTQKGSQKNFDDVAPWDRNCIGPQVRTPHYFGLIPYRTWSCSTKLAEMSQNSTFQAFSGLSSSRHISKTKVDATMHLCGMQRPYRFIHYIESMTFRTLIRIFAPPLSDLLVDPEEPWEIQKELVRIGQNRAVTMFIFSEISDPHSSVTICTLRLTKVLIIF